MRNKTWTLNMETARRHALEKANRATLAIAMIVWVASAAAHYGAGASWSILAGVVPMIPLIWHGAYLFFKHRAVM